MLKYSVKTALSLTLAYMIPMYMGWSQGNIAAITVMLIASAEGVKDSFLKGLVRIVATVIGAVIGLLLVALFPQERLEYLLVLSLVVSLFAYLYYAYQWDKTVFMLSAVMTMMIFLNGPQDAFLYGVDRTFMTLFGIAIYTFIGVFLWPEKHNTAFDIENIFKFVWFEPEHFKAVIKIFLIFWFGVAFWIYFNPAGGFLIVIFAVAMGMLTTLLPVQPIALVVIFTLGFSFATLMYVFVLPNLVYAWELALFIFTYTFIAFYFLKPQLSIFFLLGLFLLGINNTMNYNFDFFLLILLTFYIILMILMLFNNFPFSSKPEHLVTLFKERFFWHVEQLQTLDAQKQNWFNTKKEAYHKTHLAINTQKLKVWIKKIDTAYFTKVTQEQLETFANACNAYMQGDTDIKSCYNASKNIDWDSLKENRF